MQQKKFNFKTIRARRIKKPFLKKSFILLGAIFLFFGLYNFFTTFFLIKTIKIASAPEEILKGIEKLGGQNLLFLDRAEWEEEIEKENPILKEVEIEKEFPSQVLIKFEKRKGRALIFGPNPSTTLLIDEEGVILKKGNKEEKLPVIIASLQNFKIGDRIRDERIIFVLDLISVLGESAKESEFEFDESLQVLKVNLADQALLLIDLEKERKKTIYSLQMLLKKFKIEGNWPKKIDLRFEKPILTF